MGTVYRRGRIWWIKYYWNGKPFRESSKSQKISDAKRLLRRREGEVATGEFLVAERVRFEELADDFLNDYRANKRKSFIWAKRRLEQHLTPFFGGVRAVDITTDQVRAYTDKRRQQGASNGSINRELGRAQAHAEPGGRNDAAQGRPRAIYSHAQGEQRS